MSKIIRKRVSALLVSALMVASSVTVTSGSFFVEAAGSTVTIGKTLETSVPNPEDKDNPLNADKCTYMCKAATDEYTSFTDTKGKSPADICGDSITTLQFNLKSDQMVTDFSYYFGASDTKANGYWWGFDGEFLENGFQGCYQVHTVCQGILRCHRTAVQRSQGAD
mgnify:CR=1 FL=1